MTVAVVPANPFNHFFSCSCIKTSLLATGISLFVTGFLTVVMSSAVKVPQMQYAGAGIVAIGMIFLISYCAVKSTQRAAQPIIFPQALPGGQSP